MKKITLEICCGTTCYMLGTQKLLQIENIMPEEWKDCVAVSAIPCLNNCTSENICGAPFVRINGEIMSHASVESIFNRIRELLPGEGEE